MTRVCRQTGFASQRNHTCRGGVRARALTLERQLAIWCVVTRRNAAGLLPLEAGSCAPHSLCQGRWLFTMPVFLFLFFLGRWEGFLASNRRTMSMYVRVKRQRQTIFLHCRFRARLAGLFGCGCRGAAERACRYDS